MDTGQKTVETSTNGPSDCLISNNTANPNENPPPTASNSAGSNGSVSDAAVIEQARRSRIKTRITRSSSRLLSLLGFRGSYNAVKTTPPESCASSVPDNANASSFPANLVADGGRLAFQDIISAQDNNPNPLSAKAKPSGSETLVDSLNDPSSVHKDSREKTGILPRTEKAGASSENKTVASGVRRSQSTPTDLAKIFSSKLSATFGNPTVIRRAHLRSRPSIRAVQFPEPLGNSLSKQGDSTNDSSSPSTPVSGTGSPFSTTSTPATSENPSNSSDKWVWLPEISFLGTQSQSPRNHESCQLSPIEEAPDPSLSIITVEATANAKVFFETFFSAINPNSELRYRRQQELEQYICSLPLTTDEQNKAREKWLTQESNYLRQYRTLKSRVHSACHDDTVSVAGYEAVKILGKGSFGVVRLVKDKSDKQDQQSDCGKSPSFKKGETVTERTNTFGSGLRSAIDGRKTMSGARKEVYAMKVIRKSEMIRNSQEGHLRAERDFLVASAKSRWVVPLIASFQDIDNLYLVMDYMVGGDFLGLLLRNDILSEKDTKWYVAEMILCVEEAHKLHWIHRDVKPDNFLISASGHLKISDFGLAFDGHWAHDQGYYNDHRYSLAKNLGIQIDGDEEDRRETKAARSASSHKEVYAKHSPRYTSPQVDVIRWRDKNQRRQYARSVVGTSQYMAPEVVRGDAYDGRCDWWSVGIILFECLYGYTPFASEDRLETKKKILTLRFPVSRSMDKLVSVEAIDLIIRMLQEKENRLCSDKYRNNDLMNSRTASRHLWYAFDRPNRDYQGYYVYSDDAADIKAHPFFNGVKWDRLHMSKPPWVPRVINWEDTRYFEDGELITDDDRDSAASDVNNAEKNGDASDMREGPLNGNPAQQSPGKPIPSAKDEKRPAQKPIAKGCKRNKDKKRARDKILRDEKVRRTVMEMRKQGAFLGYTYRRPKGVAMALDPERGRHFLSRGHLSDLYAL